MTEFKIIGVIVVIIAAVVILRRHRQSVPWQGDLRRLHPGVSNKAEWMAPDEVISRVETDYAAAQQWLCEVLMSGYMRYIQEAPQYFTGSYLKQQQRNAIVQMRKPGPRLIGILRASHHVRVRHFSDDGLTCLLVDHQTERRMATYDYWQLRRINTLDLGEGAYVYRMVYDKTARRWKIEDLIQQLPLGWGAEMVSTASIRLDESLPIASGRDT